MLTTQKHSAEELAKLFHHYRNALATDFDCAEEAHSILWEHVPENERKLMVAAARLALFEMSADRHESATPRSESTEFDRRYFSRPGEAEWGC